jgi:hypothetical protein
MAGKNTAAFGIYRTQLALEEGIDALKSANFRREDISVLFPDNVGTKDFGHVKATKAPEGASAGAGTGAVIGGVLGWLAGIGAIAIPGIGPFIAAGPIMTALAGLGVGGTVGGITGSLIGLGIPEYEAKRYEGRIRSGGFLISVHCDDSDWSAKAKDILKNTGAEDVSSTSEARADFAKGDKPVPRGRVERPSEN